MQSHNGNDLWLYQNIQHYEIEYDTDQQIRTQQKCKNVYICC
jgi:hypothetical protein